ncbi:phage late control D family protein [Psychrobacillus sp. FSL K6-1464]|uniref:phage late control D family protein n=1 Tax=Psychrobacillus sp. FSL K6-1464 TaxID=2921545 RepID=UPI0030F6A684
MLTRRAYVEVTYQGVDITTDLNKDLISFTFTDNASGEADDISISISDTTHKWINNWKFEQGDTLKANIVTINWRKDGEKKRLPCGSFMVDEPEYSGRPSVVNLKGISTPANSNFMHTKRSKAWKNVSIKALGTEIANRYGMKLFFDSKTNPILKKKEQSDTSDAAFFQQVCEDEGFAFKVTDQQLIVFNEKEYEDKKTVATFKEDDCTVIGYSFKPTLTDTGYAGVSLSYFDSQKKKLIQYLFSTKEIDPKKDKVYKINKRVSNLEEAKRLAQSTLRKKNKKQLTATLELVGDTRILASCTIELKGFGSFSGKYYVDKASHSLAGFKTTLELHRILGGY